ncbi:hypothetical protein J1836_11240 [Thiothrix fructosivorans]|nr:hypothetical protein [Thiothrix fructosivorans]
MALWAFYVWWKKDRHTRERFAFFGFIGIFGFVGLYLSAFLLENSIIGSVLMILLKPFGFNLQPLTPPLSPLEAVLFFFVILVLAVAYVSVFKNWNGQKSLAQHEQEQNCDPASILRDIRLFLERTPDAKEKRKPYSAEADQYNTLLDRPETLTWHERAKQLWCLRNRSYLFGGEFDPAHKCWIGEEKHTGALVLLACPQYVPSAAALSAWLDYARKVADHQEKKAIELIITHKEGEPNPAEHHPDYSITYTNEAALLLELVDFSDYFADIQYRVERAKLPESHLTLQDTYTPSLYRLAKEAEPQPESLEVYIQQWLRDNSSKQLAVLGEYGQGKSTVSLLLSYHLIKQYSFDTHTSIPILIELRGKTLRSLPPEELLATWAYRYGINVKALLHLHMAGRLLLIFEGFDEIDLSGDTEARISHFHSLWKLNYQRSKLIITGRPNFFLDSKELTRALGETDQTHTLYLQPFNVEQIENSLRSADEQVRHEIVQLAKEDKKFLEVASRPSLLHLVALLWKREELHKHEHINSATVIDLFIQQTLKRQQDKNDERPFMILNTAERHYFMMGIAAYMAVKNLPNQIGKDELTKTVNRLIDAVPEDVSRSVSSLKGEDACPLRSNARFEWNTRRTEIIEKINTDVRSCGLLVTDLSKDGMFKFAHKSYMELLQAKVISQLFSFNKTSATSIKNTMNMHINDALRTKEVLTFFAELLKADLSKNHSEIPIQEKTWRVLFDEPQFKYFPFAKSVATFINIYIFSLLAPLPRLRLSSLPLSAFFLSLGTLSGMWGMLSVVGNVSLEKFLLLTPSLLFLVGLGVGMGITSIFISKFLITSSLWFLICRELQISDEEIRKYIGKKMMVTYEKLSKEAGIS